MISKADRVTRRFRLTAHAKEDLYSIWLYSLQQWGEQKADAYIEALYQRFALLAEQPQLGVMRDDVAPGYFGYTYASHIIFYLIAEAEIDIIGVPHQRLDVQTFFQPR